MLSRRKNKRMCTMVWICAKQFFKVIKSAQDIVDDCDKAQPSNFNLRRFLFGKSELGATAFPYVLRHIRQGSKRITLH